MNRQDLFRLALPMVCAVICAGCSNDSDESIGEAATSTVESDSSVASAASNGASPLRTAAVSNDGSETGSSAIPLSPDEIARQQEAREAFATLMANDTSPEEWELLHTRLVELGKSSVPVLSEKLGSITPFERETASSLLALLGPLGADAADAIALAMQDSSGFVRANAAAALAQIPGRGEETVPVFAELVLADDPQLRRMATANLATFGPPAPALVANLTEALQGDDVESLIPAVELLGRIGPSARAALPRLQQIAFETSADSSLRTAAQQAVALIEATPD